ncbi:MAG: hypothetical protein P4L90_23485 [Rhodopila sp.]|nr:hypothetical protein [Rhodopila sp.]
MTLSLTLIVAQHGRPIGAVEMRIGNLSPGIPTSSVKDRHYPRLKTLSSS